MTVARGYAATPSPNTMPVMSSNPTEILQHVFGYDSFRGLQASIIETLITGQDALVLMPTGGGKSLCYQIPALIRPGAGIVISPLIALMQDQVDALRQVGVKAASWICWSTQPSACSPSTRLIAFLNGVMTFAAIICNCPCCTSAFRASPVSP